MSDFVKDINVPTNDCISRQAAIDALKEHRELYCDNTPNIFSKLPYGEKCRVDELDTAIATLVNLPSAQPEVIRCKDCKHFELDHFEKVEGFPVPIIVAHEICMKWSDGCRTSKDGWCFMGERRTDGSD